jgi:hypothetical protein
MIFPLYCSYFKISSWGIFFLPSDRRISSEMLNWLSPSIDKGYSSGLNIRREAVNRLT